MLELGCFRPKENAYVAISPARALDYMLNLTVFARAGEVQQCFCRSLTDLLANPGLAFIIAVIGLARLDVQAD
jgi:hypothetical protein